MIGSLTALFGILHHGAEEFVLHEVAGAQIELELFDHLCLLAAGHFSAEEEDQILLICWSGCPEK